MTPDEYIAKYSKVWAKMRLDRAPCVVCGSPRHRRLVPVIYNNKGGVDDTPCSAVVLCASCHKGLLPETEAPFKDTDLRRAVASALVARLRIYGRSRQIPAAYKRTAPFDDLSSEAVRMRARQWAERLAEVMQSLGYKIKGELIAPIQKQRKPMTAEGRANLSAARVKQWAEWRERENE